MSRPDISYKERSTVWVICGACSSVMDNNDMRDEVWRRNEVDSPCVRICAIHPTERICIGCYRTIEEIAAWSRMESEVRQAIKAELPARAPRLSTRRGGRAARISRQAD